MNTFLKSNIATAIIMFLLVTLLTGCFGFANPMPGVLPPDGQVGLIQVGSTLYGIEQVLASATGTEIAYNGNLILFVWTESNGGIGFCGFNLANGSSILQSAVATGGKANLVNVKTFLSFKENLIAEGWTFTKFSELALEIASTIELAVTYYASKLGMFDLILVPLIVTTPQVPETIDT